MPRNILFISYDGMTDPLGQSQVIPYLQGLSLNGYKIFLLSCEKQSAYIQHKPVVEDLLKGFNIEWVPLKYTRTPPVLSTLNDVQHLKKAASRLHRMHGIDLVHTRPGVPELVGLWMKKKYGIKFLNDIREFYADSRVEGGMWDLKNPVYNIVYKFFKRKEAESVVQSDGIVCLTYAGEKIIRQWPEYKERIPLEVIPCSVDLELFDPSAILPDSRAALKKELGIAETDLVISYLGSIGGWYLTAEMMQFCKVLSDKIPAIKFLFISPHRHEDIKAAAYRYGISAEKLVIKKASRNQVPALLSLSDYSMFFIKPCYSKQSSSPTKHGEIMAMGIPLITNSGVGDVEMIVNKYQSGFVLQDFSQSSFEKLATEIAGGNNFDAAAIRQGAQDFYALETAIKKYCKVYNSIFAQSAILQSKV